MNRIVDWSPDQSFVHDQKVKTKFKSLENKKSFQGEIKIIVHHF